MYIVDRTCICHLSFDGSSVCMYVRSSDDDFMLYSIFTIIVDITL